MLKLHRLEENIYLEGEPRKVSKAKIKDKFALVVKIAPVVGGKQVQRKKKFKFNDISLYDAVVSLRNVPSEMKAVLLDGSSVKAEQTVSDVWDEFLKFKVAGATRKRWRDSTAGLLNYNFNHWVRHSALGCMNVDLVKKKDVYGLISDIVSQGRSSGANSVLDALRPMFKWYIDINEQERMNPASVETPAKLVREPLKVETELACKLYDACVNYPLEHIRRAFVLLWQGRRIGESLSLENADITEDGIYTILAHKNKAKVAMSYVTPELFNASEGQWAVASERNNSQPLSPTAVSHHWKKILTACGSEHIRMHDIRKILAKIAQDGEVPLEYTSMLLGHSSTHITTVYTGGNSPEIASKVSKFIIDRMHGNTTVWSQYA